MDVSTDFRAFAFVTGPVVVLACMISVCVLMVDYLSKGLDEDTEKDTEKDTETETVVTQAPTKAFASHPMVKKTIEDLLKQDIAIGYLEYSDGPFVRLSNPKMYNHILYCDHNGGTVSVASVLSQEKNLTRPRWLNYVYVEQKAEEPYTLLKEYIAKKHNLMFS